MAKASAQDQSTNNPWDEEPKARAPKTTSRSSNLESSAKTRREKKNRYRQE